MKMSTIQKQLYRENDIITLPRKTRAGIPNFNGYTYSKEAFDAAMRFYMEYMNGLVYAAPVSLSVDQKTGYEKDKVIDINNKVYASFFRNNDKKPDYVIGKVVEWDDFTFTIQLSGTLLSRQFMKYIKEDTEIALRYTPLSKYSKKETITKMNIVMLDMSIIPFEDLGIDIKELMEDKKYEEIW